MQQHRESGRNREISKKMIYQKKFDCFINVVKVISGR